jgi:HlyD family secretion protein
MAEVALEAATENHARLQQLRVRQAATPAQLEDSAVKVQQARLKLQQAELAVERGRIAVLDQQLELADRDFALKRAGLESERQTKRGEIDAARLELANFELKQRQATLVAPSDGVITEVPAKVGDLLEAGKPAVIMVQDRGFRIDVAVRSDDVGQLRVGLPVRVKLDAYDYQKYGTARGRIAFIAPDSTVSESANGPSKVAYTVKIELDGEELRHNEHAGPFKLGMTGVAEILVDRETLLRLLFRKIRHTISLS